MKLVLLSPLPPPVGGLARWTEDFFNSTKDILNITLINTAVQGRRVNKISSLYFFDEIRRFFTIKHRISELNKHIDKVAHFNISASGRGTLRDYFLARALVSRTNYLIIQIHANVHNRGLLHYYFLGKLLRLANLVLCLNEGSRQYLIENYKLSRVEKISNFIQMPPFINRSYHITPNLKIIFVGHVIPSKGVLEIFTLALLLPQHEFFLVGNSTWYESQRIAIPNNVQLVGEVSRDKVYSLLYSSDVFLFPSHSEGFPLSILEAMGAQLPIVATNVGAISEIVTDKGGYVVDVKGVNQMKLAIEELQNPEKRSSMGIYNYQRVTALYSSENIIKKLLSYYQDGVESK